MKSKGFTLIELLLVTSIVSLLGSIAVTAVGKTRIGAQDARRISDAAEMSKALEFYYDDHGQYPPYKARGYRDGDCRYNWCNFRNALLPYIDIPADPLATTQYWPYVYFYDSNSEDNYQSYGFMVIQVSPNGQVRALNDGGYREDYFEIGQQPGYCMTSTQYVGNGDWWDDDGISICSEYHHNPYTNWVTQN